MSKKSSVFLLLGLLIVFFTGSYFYLQHQELLVQRHQLLCEVLKPGMSEDEVLRILKREGEFTMRQAVLSGGNFALDIYFSAPNLSERYGDFSVVFFDYQYKRAVVTHGENPEYICDFYQATQSITLLPKP